MKSAENPVLGLEPTGKGPVSTKESSMFKTTVTLFEFLFVVATSIVPSPLKSPVKIELIRSPVIGKCWFSENFPPSLFKILNELETSFATTKSISPSESKSTATSERGWPCTAMISEDLKIAVPSLKRISTLFEELCETAISKWLSLSKSARTIPCGPCCTSNLSVLSKMPELEAT